MDLNTKVRNMSAQPFLLKNGDSSIPGQILSQPLKGGLEIFLEGYGTAWSQPGSLIYLELDPNTKEPVLYVWADINSGQYTHRIYLDGANEKNRKLSREEMKEAYLNHIPEDDLTYWRGRMDILLDELTDEQLEKVCGIVGADELYEEQ